MRSTAVAISISIVLFMFAGITPANGQTDDFTTICSQPGVVRCVGFDSTTDISGTDGNPTGIEPGTSTNPQIDTTHSSSGTGSLMFTIPANAGPNSSGLYFANFSDNLSTQFGANSEFYVQWKQMFSSSFLTAFAGGDGWKQAIIGTGDQPGKIYYACSDLEVVMENEYNRMYPQMYDSCTGSASHGSFDDFTVSLNNRDLYIQPGRGTPYCLYSTHSNCFGYYANEWMTFEIHIKTGALVNGEFTNSYIQLWIARQGQAPQMAINFGPYNLTAGAAATNQQFGKVFLLPYNTNKDSTVSYPVSYTWYDSLVISTLPIAMNGYTPPVTTGTAPAISLTALANDETVSGAVTVSADASGSSGIASVEFKLDGVSLGTGILSSPYSASWDTTTASAGAHSLTAIAYDTAGNLTTATSVSVTVMTAPGPPTSVTGTPGNTQVALSWMAPASDGGSAITGYQVQQAAGANGTYADAAGSCATALNSTTASCTATGLTNGTTYFFQVAAINAVGTGSYSTASTGITPATVPGAPTTVTSTPGNLLVTLSWTAPADDGGAAITGYEVQLATSVNGTYVKAAGTCALSALNSTTLSCTATGLILGTSYFFRVAAINAVGTGSYSTASPGVTPVKKVNGQVTSS